MADAPKDWQFSSLESEFIAQLSNEYKILQDKIDKIGAFRFTIKGWSITVIIASIFAGTATSATPVWLWVISLIGVLFLFFFYEKQQTELRYRFGRRCLDIEEEVSRILRNATNESKNKTLARSFIGLHFVPGIGHHVRSRARTRAARSKWRSLLDADFFFYIGLCVLVILFALSRFHPTGHGSDSRTDIAVPSVESTAPLTPQPLHKAMSPGDGIPKSPSIDFNEKNTQENKEH